MQIPAFSNPLILLLASAILAGCASTSPDKAAVSGAGDDIARGPMYIVQSGDRLSDIALRYTGRIDTWQIIAAFNGIDDPRKLQPGFELEIPTHLVEPDPDTATAHTATPAATATTQARVVVSAVSTNRRFDMTPIDAGNTPSDDASTGTAPESQWRAVGQTATKRHITVAGSYYPKGIYAQPAIYSELLHRVAPGTRLSLEGQFEDWYEIVTEDGETGYIRIVDARVSDGAVPADDARR